jgi:hypothetical protein
MKKIKRLVVCGLFALPVGLYGILQNHQEALLIGELGTGIILIGIIGDTIFPTMNKMAWFDRRTGRRVSPDGKAYYTGAVNFILSSLGMLSIGFGSGIFIYGIYRLLVPVTSYLTMPSHSLIWRIVVFVLGLLPVATVFYLLHYVDPKMKAKIIGPKGSLSYTIVFVVIIFFIAVAIFDVLILGLPLLWQGVLK